MATYWENSCSFGLRYVSWYEYLIVSLVFSHLGFWSGSLFLVAPFPDLCLLPFCPTFIRPYSVQETRIVRFKDYGGVVGIQMFRAIMKVFGPLLFSCFQFPIGPSADLISIIS